MYEQEKAQALLTLVRSARDGDNSTRFSNAQFSFLIAQSYDANDDCLNDTMNQYSPFNVRKTYNGCVNILYQSFLDAIRQLREKLESVMAGCTKVQIDVKLIYFI